MKNKNNDEILKSRIEAALYASGRPLRPNELAKAAGIKSNSKAIRLTKLVEEDINRHLRAVQVARLIGDKFVMQLKPKYGNIAKKFTLKPLLPSSILKTLSYIVYFQPINSSDIANQRGSQSYKHLKILQQMGFISSETSGRKKLYKTTHLFSDTFGLSEELKTMKQQLTRDKNIKSNF